MKKLSLLIAGLLLLLFSFTAAAQDFELVGGYLYTTINPQEINQVVTDVNEMLEDYAGYYDPIYLVEEDYLDQVNGGQGFFIGAATEIGKIRVTGQFEKVYFESRGKVKFQEGNVYEEMFAGLDGELNGLVFYASSSINQYIAINGGLGYYYGSGEGEWGIRMGQGDYYMDEMKLAARIDLEPAIGYLAGASFNYPLQEDLNFNASLNYRLLEMDVNGDIRMIENYSGPMAAVAESESEEIDTFTEDLSGFELTLGLTYKF